MRVVVIGAGVVGAAVAAGLARRGADVTVLEARRPGAGTTATSFGWVNAAGKEPEPYFALNHAGVRAHHALDGGGARWFFPTGNLEWAIGEDGCAALARRVERAEARDYPVERLTAAQAAALQPDLAAQPPGAEYVLFPYDGHAHPALLLARFLGEAVDRGARVVSNAAVTAIEGRAGGTHVETACGGRYAADVVVSCAGRWTEGMAALVGAHIPLVDPDLAGSATVGFLASTAPLPSRLSRVLTTPTLNVRPDGAGRLLLQALDLDGLADPAAPPHPDGPLGREIAARLPGVLSGTGGAVVQDLRVGQRVLPADGQTVAGFVEGPARVYVVATHSGVTLAPLLGDLVAGEVHGAEAGLLAGFRPSRFAGGAVPAAPRPARRQGEQ